jgi:hypothetical protein
MCVLHMHPPVAEEHVRSYLGEVLAYFWQQRSEAFAAGQMPPLGEKCLGWCCCCCQAEQRQLLMHGQAVASACLLNGC